MNFQHWLQEAINVLSESKSRKNDAEILLEFVTGKTRAFIFAFSETIITVEEEIRLNELLVRRKAGEPIAYLIGECEFWSLPLYVSIATFIPRPDTECLVEQALVRLPNKISHILDLGTGTGAIALAIASEISNCKVTAVDLMPDTLACAYRNIKRLEMYNVHVLQSYWFDALLDQKFEMIVSNPPYIDIKDPHLSKSDISFEPLNALVSSDAGIADLSYIILNAHKHLVSGGWLVVEHGWTQGKIIRAYFILAGYQYVETYCDYSGNERLTLGKLI